MPVNPATIAGAIGLGQTVIGALGGGKRDTQPAVPNDVQRIRGGQTGFFNQFQQALGSGNLQNFLQGSFGNFGSQATPLQQQSAGGIGNFLSQISPEQRANQLSLPALMGVLGQAPGQGIIDALQPSFERNLSQANQAGGRFSSANTHLRSQALQDFNLLGAQAAQTGINQQLQASQILGMLAGQQGQNEFQRLLGGFGVGQQQAGQADIETQRRLGLGTGLFGLANQAAFNVPSVQQPSALEQLGGIATNTASIFDLLGGNRARPARTTTNAGEEPSGGDSGGDSDDLPPFFG